jgi:hypothetical protein
MPLKSASKSPRNKKIRVRDLESLPPLHLNAAGIGVGSAEHYVAVPAARDPQPVQKFGSFTADLHRLARWLKTCRIDTVVMQATGVYWMGLYQVLEDYGCEVQVVNARRTKTLPGRKTDLQECQWLQPLHTFGLLNNSFRPAEQIRVLRSYMRQRENLVAAGSTCTRHIRKALTEMNVQLDNVISHLSGTTGMAILHAIGNGERDAYQLADLKHGLIRASREEIAQSPEGNWREELLFVLQQNLELYQMYQNKVRECDQPIEAHLQTMPAQVDLAAHPLPAPRRVSWSRKRQPGFDLRGELYRLTGVDLTQVDGLDVPTIPTVLSEVGIDMSAWKTEKHFGSWLGLAPQPSHPWGQGAEAGHAQGREPGSDRVAPGRLEPHPQPARSGSQVPPPANPPGTSQSDHCHGLSLSTIDLPHAQVRPRLRRQRNRVLPKQTPPAAACLAKKTSRHPSICNLFHY